MNLDFSFFNLMNTSIFILVFYITGIACAIYALWRSRSPQGATAWVIGLISFPFISIPAFIIFGRNKFYGYVRRRRNLDKNTQAQYKKILELHSEYTQSTPLFANLKTITDKTYQIGFTKNNQLKLLNDGQQTYPNMLKSIAEAQEYILLQSYIFRLDKVGQEFVDLLIRKAQEGVKVFFMYDTIGSKIRNRHLKPLIKAGAKVCYFDTRSGRLISRMQVNFRNHRKILVVDGKSAFVGGLNIGDEYLSQSKFGPWRDTHIKITGPAALGAQISFAKDWYCSTKELLQLNWEPYEAKPTDNYTMVLHTGPADEVEANLMAHIILINNAKSRIWISNPYFLPSDELSTALNLAVLRGVDVRVIVPGYSDNQMVYFASQAYQEKLLKSGVKIYKYDTAFPHQKVMLIDNDTSIIGSSNLDARSLFINFEIMAIIKDSSLATEMQNIFHEDFNNCTELDLKYFTEHSLFYKTLVRAFNLLSPIL